jgi:neutral ceramidase
MNANQLLAAAVEVDITPPVGVWLEGYFERQTPSVGVHDPLQAQLLLLQNGQNQVVLISMDLIGVRLDFTAAVRSGIRQAIGVPEENILLACSHTHSGPTGFLADLPLIHTPEEPELRRIVERKLVGAAAEAQQQLRPAQIGVGHGHVRGVGASRNDPDGGDLDDEVVVLRLDDSAGAPIVVWMNYGCHPTVMGPENLLITADYPGAARRTLRRIYPETVFMYANGASGDVSTRFTRRGQTFAEVERMGRILAGEVLKVMQSTVASDTMRLSGRIEPIDLTFRPFPSEDEARRETERFQSDLERLQSSGASHGELRRAMTRAEGAMAREILIRELEGKGRMRSQLQALAIGPLALVALPGEPFTQIVLDIKAESRQSHTAVVSYGNDEAGYFPDAQAFATGTYESLISPYREDVAERICEQALKMLRAMG